MKINASQVISLMLVIAVIASAMALVSVRQYNRLSFYKLLKIERQRDDLSIEWRQMMAEYSTWRREHNVEHEVRGEHKMEPPTSQSIQTIHLAASVDKKEGSR